MNKKLLAFILFIPFIALLAWTMWLYTQQATGKDVKVAVMGYDPIDLLSGHYIRYTIDWSRTDCRQFENGICPKNEFCKQSRWGRECRFYIPEKNAAKLDRLFQYRNSTGLVFEVVYSYRKGFEPIAKQMLINGKPWREYLDNSQKKTTTNNVQKIENNNSNQLQNNGDEDYNAGCVKYCGDDYFYSGKGAKNGGKELVCTKYPFDCKYDCTLGWSFRYLVDGTNYTCQEAQQDPSFSKKALKND